MEVYIKGYQNPPWETFTNFIILLIVVANHMTAIQQLFCTKDRTWLLQSARAEIGTSFHWFFEFRLG